MMSSVANCGHFKLCWSLLLVLVPWTCVRPFKTVPTMFGSRRLMSLPPSPPYPQSLFDIFSRRRHHPHVYLSINPNDIESPEEREERMKLVRQIQKSFYQATAPGDDDGTEREMGLLKSPSSDVQRNEDPTILHNVPLWRVQWTELPGYQNVLNVHVAHYTHMFHTIVNSGPKPWLFGHIFLPGGSENMDNPKYRLPDLDQSLLSNLDGFDPTTSTASTSSSPNQATLVGTLMQVSDYKQLDDGRLALIVQGMERFRILGATQHEPYAIATIQRIPDVEETFIPASKDIIGGSDRNDDDDNGNSRSMKSSFSFNAMQEATEWREWEFRPTLWKDLTPTSKDIPSRQQENFISVSPLVNYDANHFPNELAMLSGGNDDLPSKQDWIDRQNILKVERDVWVSLDTMLRLLTTINPQLRIPVPSQLLGLLPLENVGDDDGSRPWPAGFRLEEYATQLQKNNAIIGTTSKSPFVRVSENGSYPVTRRASRFSYVIWVILESILLPPNPSRVGGDGGFAGGPPTKQRILEETSILKRLQMAHTQLETVNDLLRQTLQ